MSVLAFSYQFWSQAQNVATFTLACFSELCALNFLLIHFSYTTAFKRLAIIASICGIATGTDLPVIVTVLPSILLMIWSWRAGLSMKRFFILCLLGIAGIIIVWSYLPLSEIRKPFINDVNGSTFQGFWTVITNQGGSFNNALSGLVTGLTWSPIVMLTSAWHYLVMAWMDFTPFLLPLIVLGAARLWRKQRHIFLLLFLIVITNFIFSILYLSGNQESWYLQSDVIFAVFAGAGYAWITEIITTRVFKLHLRIVQAVLFLLAFIPLIYWWSTLDRHDWHFTQDYIENLYRPIQEPAILVGWGDLWSGASSYAYVTNYKPNVIPILAGGGLLLPWQRKTLTSTTDIIVPDPSQFNAHPTDAEYSRVMNDFFADNIGKYHIYITNAALQAIILSNENHASLQIDLDKFRLIPRGMFQEIIPTNKKPTINLNDFTYRFGNGFPQMKPYFLEQSYTDEIKGVIYEMVLSYDSAANFLMYQGKFDEAGALFHKAFVLAPKDFQILGDLGLFYGKQNQPEKALDYFTKAYAIQPGNMTWLYNIAIAKGQLGKIDEEKKDIKRIMDNPQIDATFKQSLIEQLNSLNQKTGSPEASVEPQMPTVPSGWKQFTNTAMNLTFDYPQTLQLNHMSPQLVSLSDSPSSDIESQMLIYSTVVSDGNLRKIPLPYHISGKLVQQQPAQFPGFQALMDVYSDTSGQTLLLLLHKGLQVVAVRFPIKTTLDKEMFNQIARSIATLH